MDITSGVYPGSSAAMQMDLRLPRTRSCLIRRLDRITHIFGENEMTQYIERQAALEAVLAVLPLTVAGSKVEVLVETSSGDYKGFWYDASFTIQANNMNRKIIFRFGFGSRNDDPFWVELKDQWFDTRGGKLTIRHQCLVEPIMESMRAQLSRSWSIIETVPDVAKRLSRHTRQTHATAQTAA